MNLVDMSNVFELKLVGSSSGLLNFSSSTYAPGVLALSMTPARAETLSLSVSLNGTMVAGAPFLVQVQPGSVSPLLSSASGLAGQVEASVPQSFSLLLRDEFGSSLVAAGAVVVQFDPPATSFSLDPSGRVTYELAPGR